MLLVYKDGEPILGAEDAPALLPGLVEGVREIAGKFYGDELVSLEKDGILVSAYFSPTNVMFLWAGERKDAKDLRKCYELYSVAMVYGDLDLFRELARHL